MNYALFKNLKQKYKSLAILLPMLLIISGLALVFQDNGIFLGTDDDENSTTNIEKIASLTINAPLDIRGDADLLNQASHFGWSGTGSSTNPIKISNLLIQQPGSHLITMYNTQLYITIENCVFDGVDSQYDGLYFNNATHITLQGNIIKNTQNPLIFFHAPENILTGNTIINGLKTIEIEESNNTVIKNNKIGNVPAGLTIWRSPNGVIDNNVFLKSGLNFVGIYVNEITQNSVFNNTVNGLPLVYKQSATSGSISSAVGQVILVNCTNIAVSGLTISDTSSAIGLYFSNQITTSNNILKNNNIGISLFRSNSSTISNNEVYNSIGDAGIRLDTSYTNSIGPGNLLVNNTEGMYLVGSNSNTISSNTAKDNQDSGIYLSGEIKFNKITFNTLTNNRRGMVILYATSNSIENNILNNNKESGLEMWDSSDNTVNANTISDNTHFGIVFFRAPSNTVTNNILVNDGFYLQSEYTNMFTQTYVFNNTVNGKKLEFIQNQIGSTITKTDIGQLIIIGSKDIVIQGLTLSNVSVGIQVINSIGTGQNKFLIQNNVMVNNHIGIDLYYSSGISLDGNSITNSTLRSVSLLTSNNSYITNNNFENGIRMMGFDLASYSQNLVNNNTVGSGSLFYFKNSVGPLSLQPSANVGQAIFVNVTNGKILGHHFNKIDAGITVAYSKNILIQDNVFDNCGETCMYVTQTNQSFIVNNTMNNAFVKGELEPTVNRQTRFKTETGSYAARTVSPR